jgi:hypothetical protein
MFASIVSVFVLLSLSSLFYKFIVLKDFNVLFNVDCDPSSEACFINFDDCSETTTDDDCAYPYKVISISQYLIDSKCQSDDGSCLLNLCESDSTSCDIIYCTNNESIDRYEIYDGCKS